MARQPLEELQIDRLQSLLGPVLEGNSFYGRKLRAAGVHWDTVEQVASDGLPLDGQTWVITGALASMARDEAKAKLQALGAKVVGSVSAKTTALLAGEKAGSKLTKAEKLGVKVVGEDEFLTMLEES